MGVTTIKVLILGKYDVLSYSLIARCKKDNHQVFVVTGHNRKSVKVPAGVFQEYAFSLDSESINYILNAVKPDIIYYKGIYDELEHIDKDPSRLKYAMAGLTNAIVNCKGLNVKDFVYISSMDVFSDVLDKHIKIDTIPACKTDAQRALLLGEKLVEGYLDAYSTKFSIARLGEIYGVHRKEILMKSVLIKMVKEAMFEDKITISSRKMHHLIYIDDAVDYIYRLGLSEQTHGLVHHVTPLKQIGYSELQLAESLVKLIGEDRHQKQVEIETQDEFSSGYNHIYNNSPDEEFKVYEKYYIDQGIESFYKVAKKVLKKSHKQEGRKASLRDLINLTLSRNNVRNLLENIIFFAIIQLLMVVTRDMSFHGSVDIYLVYVIIISIIYGYLQSIFAVTFAALGKIYIDITYSSPYLEFSGYDVYLWIIQIFTVGVLIGYLKDKYRRRYADYMDERDYLVNELEILKEINDSNVKIKSEYENRLLNYRNSFARIYDLISRFDVVEPQKVIFKSIHVITDIMKSQDVTIYNYDNDYHYCRMLAASSERSKHLGKTVKLTDHPDIYNKLIMGEIFINTSLNEDYPMMIGGTYSGGHLSSIIMIWTLPFDSFNLYEKNNFGVLCTLVGTTILRAQEYMESINESYNYTDDQVMTNEAFSKILEIYEYGEQEGVVDYTVLKLSEEQRLDYEDILTLLKQQVRETDYIGQGPNDSLEILLTNTTLEESNFVINRLKDRTVFVENVRRDHVN